MISFRPEEVKAIIHRVVSCQPGLILGAGCCAGCFNFIPPPQQGGHTHLVPAIENWRGQQ